MHLSRWHFRLQSHRAASQRATPLRLLALVLVLLIGLSNAPVRAENNEATAVKASFGVEYAVPNGPRNLTEEAPGRIWYTSTDGGGIGLLEVVSDPNEPAVRYRTDFYGLGEKSNPYDIVYDRGVVWFTLQGLRALGRIDVATREIKTYTLLSVGAAPTGLDVDPSGNLWVGQSNGRISRFDPVTEEFEEFIMSDAQASLPRVEDIIYQNSRAIWFTMPDANVVMTYDPVRDRFFETPTGELQPMGITLDAKGQLWITAAGTSRIGRYTPTTVSIWIWYDTPTPDSGPIGILAFDNMAGSLEVWVTENKTGTIGRLQLMNGFEVVNTEKAGPNTPAGNTWGIIRSSDKHIWVADTGRNLLYELDEPYFHRTYITSVVKESTAE